MISADRLRQQAAVVAQALQRLGLLEQRLDHHESAEVGGLAAGADEDRDHHHDLVVEQREVALLAAQQVGDQVLAERAAALRHHLAKPRRHLLERRLGGFDGILRRQREEAADHLLRQCAEAHLVGAGRDADDAADDRIRDRVGEVAHQVDHLARAAAQRRREALDHLADLRVHAAHRARCERAVEQAPEARVRLGPLGHQVVLFEPAPERALGRRLIVLPEAAVLVAVLRIVEQALHVVVARHQPEAERLDEVDGIVRAQPVQHRVRIVGVDHLEEGILHRGSSGLRINRLLVYIWTRCQPQSRAATSDAARRRPTASSKAPPALFGERGVAATTVADICERADVARQTFFNHFETKQELVQALARRGNEFFEEAVATARREGHDTASRITRLFEVIHTAAASVGPMHQDMVSEVTRAFHDTSDPATYGACRVQRSVESLLRAGRAEGDVSRAHALEDQAAMVLGALQYLTFEWTHRADFPIAERAKRMARLLADALKP